jgi:Domain of unknown function DUF1828
MTNGDTNNIELEFRRKVSEELEIIPSGPDRFHVVTPVAFGDGDLLPITLRKASTGWELTDEGHTFLQLTYELEEADFNQSTRREIVNSIVSGFGLQNRKGELVLPIDGQQYGDALYSFIQVLTKIDDIRYLSRDRVRSTFMDDFREWTRRVASAKREVIYDWNEPHKDPTGNYPVDCKINGTGTPIFLFALPNNQRVAIAALSIHMFQKWGVAHKSIGIFEDQAKIDPRMVARFTDVCNKPFSTLAAAEEHLVEFFPELAQVQ